MEQADVCDFEAPFNPSISIKFTENFHIIHHLANRLSKISAKVPEPTLPPFSSHTHRTYTSLIQLLNNATGVIEPLFNQVINTATSITTTKPSQYNSLTEIYRILFVYYRALKDLMEPMKEQELYRLHACTKDHSKEVIRQPNLPRIFDDDLTAAREKAYELSKCFLGEEFDDGYDSDSFEDPSTNSYQGGSRNRAKGLLSMDGRCYAESSCWFIGELTKWVIQGKVPYKASGSAMKDDAEVVKLIGLETLSEFSDAFRASSEAFFKALDVRVATFSATIPNSEATFLADILFGLEAVIDKVKLKFLTRPNRPRRLSTWPPSRLAILNPDSPVSSAPSSPLLQHFPQGPYAFDEDSDDEIGNWDTLAWPLHVPEYRDEETLRDALVHYRDKSEKLRKDVYERTIYYVNRNVGIPFLLSSESPKKTQARVMQAPKVPRLTLHTRLLFQSQILRISHLANHIGTPVRPYEPNTAPITLYTELLRILALQSHHFISALKDRFYWLSNVPSKRKSKSELQARLECWKDLQVVLELFADTLKHLEQLVKEDVDAQIKRWKGLKERYWAVTVVENDISNMIWKRIPPWRKQISDVVAKLERKIAIKQPVEQEPGLGMKERLAMVGQLGLLEMLLDQYHAKERRFRRVRLNDVRSDTEFQTQTTWLTNCFYREFEVSFRDISMMLGQRLYNTQQANRVAQRLEEIIEAAMAVFGTVGESETLLDLKWDYDDTCDKESFFGGALVESNNDSNLTFGVDWSESDTDSGDDSEDAPFSASDSFIFQCNHTAMPVVISTAYQSDQYPASFAYREPSCPVCRPSRQSCSAQVS
ncbi:hypothetical protein BJ508DRAFT_314020 [Ascobolus immersus RN42]|uniref:Uncharacterized protein n=1 Tax=Ascobolus immersus RN42 TaxID=1160509 RepID=A0A3N4HGL4_ASCIM|nr:hypothetical protein BJ508DRAFT_314020 [Ascobolus immersus RN42]